MDDYRDDVYSNKRGLAGRLGVGVFFVAVLFIAIAFCTPYWLESDQRIIGSRFEKLGLWTHCFRTLPDASEQYLTRFTTGCRWIFDPLTTGFYDVRNFIVPPFFIAVQFCFTICFVILLVACVLVPMYLLCFAPDHRNYPLLIKVIGLVLILSAVLGSVAVIVFGAMGDSRAWMPDWQNNYFSWSYVFACIGVLCEYVSGAMFILEGQTQTKRRKLRGSHTVYTLEGKHHA